MILDELIKKLQELRTNEKSGQTKVLIMGNSNAVEDMLDIEDVSLVKINQHLSYIGLS